MFDRGIIKLSIQDESPKNKSESKVRGGRQ